MDNNEPLNTPTETPPEAPVSAIGSAGTWVPKDEYNAYKEQQARTLKKAHNNDIKTKAFYILLAIGGLMVAVAYIGTLVAPTVTTPGRGTPCTSSTFGDTQFLLDFLGLPLLFITGIFGAAINRVIVRTLGIIIIIVTPLVTVVMLALALGNALCGA